MALADLGHDLNIQILEAREEYHHDRHWGFWVKNGEKFKYYDLIGNTWAHWRFSDGRDIAIHHGHDYHYAILPSDRFYQAGQAAIADTPGIKLKMGVRVTNTTEHNGGDLAIHTDNGQYMARHVIDTRPPSQSAITNQSKLFQCFFGLVLQSNQPIFDADVAGIMDGLMVRDQSCDFIYTLPFDERTALIEYTRFTTTPVLPRELKPLLDAHLSDNNLQSAAIFHQEGAIIPMGFKHDLNPSGGRVIQAGLIAGNVRASSGYAFRRILNWADWAAKNIIDGKIDNMHHYQFDTGIQSWMDDIFLTVCDQSPEKLPNIFMRMGHQMPGDRFARFMMDRASVMDLLSMIWAMPKRPFLKAVFT
jgi:lycopene beta-cyclase